MEHVFFSFALRGVVCDESGFFFFFFDFLQAAQREFFF